MEAAHMTHKLHKTHIIKSFINDVKCHNPLENYT
jgi:hypothetical protein